MFNKQFFGLYNSSKQFYTKISRNCVIGSMGNFFSRINPLFDSSFCFFLLKKTRLTYSKNGKKISGIHISQHLDDCFFDFARLFNLMSVCKKSKEHNLLKLVLKKGLPLILEVNSKTLSYHDLYKINKWNLTHFITIIGVNRKKILISDCYIPKINGSEFYEGYADINDIEKAWRKNNYWYYDSSDVVEFVKAFEIKGNLCRNIFHENMKLLLETSIPCQKVFAEDFAQYLKNYKLKDIKKHLNNLSMQIQTLGLIASRAYLKEFLIYHLDYKNEEVLGFIDSDIKEWQKICFAIYKSTITCLDSSFESVKRMIINQSEKEFSVYSKLNSEIN